MRTIVLSGFMATGKTTVGQRLAVRLGLPFVDTDDAIARDAGRSVADLWRDEGEAAFRAREAEAIAPLLRDPAPKVIALGGGSVTNRALRHLALDRAFVVTLTAPPAVVVARAGQLASRPNLAQGGDAGARAAHLLEERAAAYAEAHLTLATDAMDPDAVVEAIVAGAQRDPIGVALGRRTYQVDVVIGQPARLTDALARLAPSSLVVVTDSHVQRARSKALDAALSSLAFPATRVTLPSGEAHKTIATVGTIWDAALGAGVDRDAVLVAFGGGVVGDLTGFAAATLLRGVRFVQVPTTLLAMVDAAVGGKTGFDHPAGKNLVGAFHQPSAVVADLEHLTTLPARERTAGLAEVVKIALACDGELLAQLEASADAVARGEPAALAPVVRRAIEDKAKIVRDDEHEAGARALLNLGHTIGHALEAHGGYARYLHGEAVAIGTVLELEAAWHLGLTSKEIVDRARAITLRLGLPAHAAPAEVAASWSFVGADKKRRGASIKLPVVGVIGAAEVRDVALGELRAAALAGV